MSLLGMLKGKGANGFGYQSSAEDVTVGLDLSTSTILVTGANSGLGLETLRVLGARGATMIAAARSIEKAEAALSESGLTGMAVECELSEPASVRACVETIKNSGKASGKTLDAIICNAGIMALPKLEQKHGYELQFFTNHIGHFILVTGLIDSLSETGRVVMLSSSAHQYAPAGGIVFDDLSGEQNYSAWKNYGQSKLANLLFAKELSKRFASNGRSAFAVHPGVIATNLGRHMSVVARGSMAFAKPLFLKDVPQGSATQCYVAVHPDAASHSGEYFADCNISKASKYASDDTLAARLWEVSEEIVRKLE